MKLIKLTDVFHVGSSKRVLKADWKGSGVPFYRGREITRLSKTGSADNELFISESHFGDLSTKYGVPIAGDIMVTAIGTIGNTYIVTERDRFYFKDASVLWLHKKVEVDSRFIDYWLKSDFFFGQLDKGNGATVDTLTIEKLSSVELALPSLEKQREIVEKLDKAFAEMHAATELNEKLIKFSRDLLSSYIREIYAEREDEHTENLGDLLELLADHRGKTPKKLGSDFVEAGVRIISAANITKGAIRFERKERYISQSTYEKWMPKALMRGDVILTSEAPLGEVAQVDFDDPIAIGQRLYALRGKFDRISNDYLRYFLISERGQSELRARETGATAIGIRQSELVQLRVPIIPIELQLERIQLLKKVELLSGSLSNLFQMKKVLFKELNSAILNEAFAGERQ
jgi:type I restriction enzyme S subunit